MLEALDLLTERSRPVKLCYAPTDPLVLILSIYQGDDWHDWRIARTALGDAYLAPVDAGDLYLEVRWDNEAIIIDLHPAGGHMRLALHSARVYEFLTWTHSIVVPCRRKGVHCYDLRCTECASISADLAAALAMRSGN